MNADWNVIEKDSKIDIDNGGICIVTIYDPEQHKYILDIAEYESEFPHLGVNPEYERKDVGFNTRGDWFRDQVTKPYVVAWMPLPEPFNPDKDESIDDIYESLNPDQIILMEAMVHLAVKSYKNKEDE